MSVIESDRYRDERAALKADPIIQQMAAEIGSKGALVVTGGLHKDGSPTFMLMMSASDTYRNRGGKLASSIGGPARAVLELLDER